MEAGCSAGTEFSVAFDVALRGNDGDGSLNDVPGGDDVDHMVLGSHNVRFIRASN